MEMGLVLTNETEILRTRVELDFFALFSYDEANSDSTLCENVMYGNTVIHLYLYHNPTVHIRDRVYKIYITPSE